MYINWISSISTDLILLEVKVHRLHHERHQFINLSIPLICIKLTRDLATIFFFNEMLPTTNTKECGGINKLTKKNYKL